VARFEGVVGKKGEVVEGASQWEPELPYPGAAQFTEAYKKEFPGADLSYHSASGYAGCQILVEAVKKAGSLDGEKIRAEILKLETSNTFGPVQADHERVQAAHH